MKTRSANDESADFEAWARLLICRKVPVQYQDLINSEVVRDGAEILKQGEAFEVHVYESTNAVPKRSVAAGNLTDKRIIVTPFPPYPT